MSAVLIPWQIRKAELWEKALAGEYIFALPGGDAQTSARWATALRHDLRTGNPNAEVTRWALQNALAQHHVGEVTLAFVAGEAVPLEVLADYPELAAKVVYACWRQTRQPFFRRGEADSVADFLRRYYKPARYHGRGADYAAALLTAAQADFQQNGYTVISRHDSVIGEPVAFFGPPFVAPIALNGRPPLNG